MSEPECSRVISLAEAQCALCARRRAEYCIDCPKTPYLPKNLNQNSSQNANIVLPRTRRVIRPE